MSIESGVNIICCTGLYTSTARPEHYLIMPEDDMYHLFMQEIINGIGETGIHPGFVKSALGNVHADGTADENDYVSLPACARTAQDSGLALYIHTNFPMMDDQIVDAVKIALTICNS